ncbi:MAG: geranylgeranylglyceryl/heptaprenylglyceryl phosphate synthase [Deltaproteobacteria bacterium]|nr:geranylgeranylglyceryl/heptaprenylglyceryl phosphate synthase [Deltaproteobacteria bacterium]
MSISELIKEKKGILHFTLIDPDRQTLEELGHRVKVCSQYGTDAFMVGGSSTFSQRLLDKTVKTIKKAVDLPVILFPSSAAALSKYADYVFFMSLLNADDPRFLIKEQVLAAPFIEKTSVHPISIAYIVISTSRQPTAIERRVKLDIIRHEDTKKILDYALAAQYFGMSCVYLEAGSGADKPVPVHMIKAVKNKIKVPLIIGGGIRNAEQAKDIADAGANVLVTGTIVEQNLPKLKSIITAIKTAQSKE